ncbi:hypothetical protein B0H12DRAFT_1321230 [Mycena haematopus]|nr:hypothetical protein B0H12DRAFT_1321230 [Mycena haematopus]
MIDNVGLRARLAEVEASIDQLKPRLEVLEDTRLSIQRQLDSVVYPVLTLPPEITSHIFLQCLPPVPNLDSRSKEGPTSLQAPLLLLQICRIWRRLALSTPRLWVYLHLNLAEIPEEIGESELKQFIADWFSRAGSCPLSFSIEGYPGMDGFGPEAISAIIQLYAPRLQSICLKLEQDHFQQLVGIGPFPILQNLLIGLPFLGNEHASDEAGLWQLNMFSTAPRLHQLSYAEAATPWMFSVPYGTLTTLTCDGLDSYDFFDVLESADRLEEFSCSVHVINLFVPPVPVTHNHLQTLRLTNFSSVHFIHFLRLPSLQDLSLHITPTGNNRDIVSFLAHSASLRRFSTGSQIRELSVEWFSAMPGLTDIEVSDPSSSLLLEFFLRMGRTQHEDFLSHLRSLAFLRCRPSCVFDESMVHVLASRCSVDEKSARLESFRLIWRHGYTELEEPMILAFRGLVERRMNIHVGPARRNDI